jgi:hypothetical protein
MLAGTGKFELVVGLLPHPASAAVIIIKRGTANSTEPDLAMYPPRLVAIHEASI